MRRRSFIAAMGSLALMRPATGQRVHRVGTLVNGTQKAWAGRVAALRDGLRALNYVEGRNLSLVSGWNDGGLEALPDLAADLLRQKPDVVVCGLVLTAAAVNRLDKKVPIVLATGAGLVKTGLAKSFARPGGNVTGIETSNEELTSKHLELLKVIAPRSSRVGVLGTGNFLFYEEAWKVARAAAKALKLDLVEVRIASAADLDRLDAARAKAGCDALYVMPDPLSINWRAQIVERAARLRLPAMYYQPEFVHEGGLISYSANIEDMFRRAADFVDRILRGARAGDLPVELASKFELVINLKTARSLGLSIPADVLARADRIVQ